MAQSSWPIYVTISKKCNFQHPKNPTSKIRKKFNYKKINILIFFKKANKMNFFMPYNISKLWAKRYNFKFLH